MEGTPVSMIIFSVKNSYWCLTITEISCNRQRTSQTDRRCSNQFAACITTYGPEFVFLA